MKLLLNVLVAGSIGSVLVSLVKAVESVQVVDTRNHLRSDTTIASSSATSDSRSTRFDHEYGSAHRSVVDNSSECGSISDVICGHKDFKLMCESITRKEYGYNIPDFADSNKTFTMFVPTDDVYIQLNNPEWSNYGIDRFINFHFYENMMLTYDELKCTETITSMSPAGDESRTKCEKNDNDNGVVKYQVGKGNTKIGDQDPFPKPMILREQSNIKACNAIIHAIDGIMLPVTIRELAQTLKALTPIPPSQPDNTKVVYIIRHGEKVYLAKNTTAYKYACESQQGWARAYNMKTVFGQRAEIFETPGSLFSFNYDDETIDCKTSQGWYRTQATIAPLALALGDLEINNITGSTPGLCGLTMDSANNDKYPGYNTTCHKPLPFESTHDYGPCCNVQGAIAIKSKLFPADGSKGVDAVLASWEHANIVLLANDLAMSDDVCKDQYPFCNTDWSGDDFDKVWALYFDKDTQEFVKIETYLAQGFDWLGPTEPSVVDYSIGPGEMPGID